MWKASCSLFRFARRGDDFLRVRALPVFSHTDKGGDRRHGWVAWPLVSYEQSPAETRVRCLWRALHYVRSAADARTAFEASFLFFYESLAGATYWNVLGGLYGQWMSRDGVRRHQLLWGIQI